MGPRPTGQSLKQEPELPRLIVVTHCEEFTLYNITLKNSPNFHVVFSGNGFTAWGVVINTPKTARNTDGIDPSSATNVTITHCFIHTGDDNIAIKAGSGGGSSHMTIAHNHFYTGHGMSIGSETDGGASAIRVTDLLIDGADNGLRIKSNDSRAVDSSTASSMRTSASATSRPRSATSSSTTSESGAKAKSPLILDPAVERRSWPFGGLPSTGSNCSVDHPLGDNLNFRKQLQANGGNDCLPPELPNLG